jgi:hypothetical protein
LIDDYTSKGLSAESSLETIQDSAGDAFVSIHTGGKHGVVPGSTPPDINKLVFSLQISNGDDKILGNRLHREGFLRQ